MSNLVLTVPRRHILAATLVTEPMPAHWTDIQRLLFEPAEEDGVLRVTATDGSCLATIVGGTHEGDWPSNNKVTIRPKDLPTTKAKKWLDTEVTITLLPPAEDGTLIAKVAAPGPIMVGCRKRRVSRRVRVRVLLPRLAQGPCHRG